MQFDSDKSNSLEIVELVEMLMENFISPIHSSTTKSLLHESTLKFRKYIAFISQIEQFLISEFRDIYAVVSENDSLTLEQFVSMCVSSKCNSMLLSTITRVFDCLLKAQRKEERSFKHPSS